MALIDDPDQILQGTETTIDRVALTMSLNLAGNLSEDGVTFQAYYSFAKEEWLNEVNNVHLYTFPFLPITPEQFEVGNNGSKFSDWRWLDDATRKLLRTGGWAEYDSTGTVLREYMGAITLGNIDATSKTVGDKAYYAFSSDTSSTEFTYAGPVNEAIQIYGDAANGNFDKRSDVLTLYIREEGKTYGQSTTVDIGVSTLTYKVERFPLSESNDDKIIYTDTEITTLEPFLSMSITYHQVAQSQVIGGVSYDFGVTVDGAVATDAQIYAFTQYQLRLTTDIDSEADAPTQIGNLQDQLLIYDGQTLVAQSVTNTDGGGTGVRVTNFDSNITNILRFTDNTGAPVTFPFVAAGNLLFNTNAVNDTQAKYWLIFKDANGNVVESDGAIIVDDNSGADISGLISGSSTIPWDFDYDGNVQGGRTSGTDATVIARMIGLNTAQYVEVEYTIIRATGQNITLSPALERVYVNP